MAATVNVLLPNGRRQNVKVTPNTRILQVIENVCNKTSYNPNEHNLKHYRTILDPELSIRYANLPNNCKLELVKADRPRTESAVHIALQVESGDRLQHEFAPATCLWDILCHWESQNASPHAGKLTTTLPEDGSEKTMHPICIYLRQEIVGEALLKATTLKSLGLTSGKAIIRLIHRAVDLPTPPPILPSAKPSKATPTVAMQSSNPPQAPVSQGHSTPPNRGDGQVEPMEVPKEETNPNTIESNTEKNTAEKESVVKRPESEMETPSNLDTANESMNSKHPEPKGVEETMKGNAWGSGGARPKQSATTSQDLSRQETYGTPLSPEIEQQANLLGAALADAIMKHRTEQQLTQLKKSSFVDFKFPEQPVSQSRPTQKQQNTSHVPEPCERQPLVFSLNQGTGDPSVSGDDVPDEFFEVTVDDIRRMMADQRLHMTSESNQSLQTKTMREASALQKAKQYPKVAVRIHFPDRYVLQGFFRPLEPIGRLREFVKTHLQEPNRKFYLYTTPPRCVLNDDTQSLFKAKLFPAAVVYFGSEAECKHYLQSDLLGEVVSLEQAREKTASIVQKASFGGEGSSTNSSVALGLSSTSASSSALAPTPTTSGLQNAQASANKRQASGESASNSQKIPKWFKIGKK